MAISEARLFNSLSLRARVALKRELQRLVRAHSAACCFLWTCSSRGQLATRVEFAGDSSSLPRAGDVGGVAIVCEQRTVVCADGESRELIVLHATMCTGAPLLVLGLVDSRAPLTDLITEDIEHTFERIEDLLVTALEPERCAEAGRKTALGRARNSG